MEKQPVSMLSFTIQVPWMSAASQGMIIPFAGMMMTSPGTSSVDMASAISANHNKREDHGNNVTDSLSLKATMWIRTRVIHVLMTNS